MEESRFYPDNFFEHGQRVRYNPAEQKLSLWQTLLLFFRHGKWLRVRKGFSDPIYPGQSGYEDAIYEADIIYDRREMERLQKLYPLN